MHTIACAGRACVVHTLLADHMSFLQSLLLVFMLAIGNVLPAAAQGPTPHDRTAAIGGWIGAAASNDAGLGSGPELGATLDASLTPRISVRGEVGIGWVGDRGGFRNDVRRLVFNLDVVHKWQRGGWHPYITGGWGW
jgi:hypothetical protein